MTLEEFKDVLQLNKLAKSWTDEYKEKKLGNYSANLKKQLKEMQILKAKTDQLIEKQAGDIGGDTDWKSLYEEIEKLAKTSPTFATCFGKADDLLSEGTPVAKETAALAIKLKKMTSAWVGQFGEDVKDKQAENLIMTIYEQAKKVLAAPKNTDGDTVTLAFYGSKSKRCRKMRKTLEFISNEYEGIVNVEINLVENEDDHMHEMGINSVPAIIFKRGKKEIATHEGSLSISALESKVNVLVEGANITNSSSADCVADLKSINKKELYSLGEYVMFYFEASWCGICKKTTSVVESQASSYSKVKFVSVQVDGSHSMHKSLGVTEVPSIVFIRDGKVIGKHVGYINPSSMDKLMEKFAVSNKHKIGNSSSGTSTLLKEGKELKDQAIAAAKEKKKAEHQAKKDKK
jgi:thioredoxin 1